MQYFEQCVRPKNKNNNNKAKHRPALYVRTNAGNNNNNNKAKARPALVRNNDNNDARDRNSCEGDVWCKLLTCPFMELAKIDDSCEGVVQTFDISFYGNGVEL
jgi:hypothetical protein